MLTWQVLEAPARVPFRIARHTYHSFGLVQVRWEHEGVIGYGEAPPNRHYGETVETVTAVLPLLGSVVEDPWDWDGWQARSRLVLGAGHPAARSAVECALLDWCGKRAGLPLWQLLGLSPGTVPPSSASLGIDTAEATVAAAAALFAAGWRRLKIKLGWGSVAEESALVQAVRTVLPQAALTVDANGGWSVMQARQMLPALTDLGVELCEQPLPAGLETATRHLTDRSDLPLFLDESITSPADVMRFADACHGVNIKVSKLSGPLAALAAVRAARQHGLGVMLGCMGESSLGLAPAVHLAPMVDLVDLYGPHALAQDPAHGLTWQGPVTERPPGDGLGVVPT